jgi:hypothetical protein
MSDLKKPTLFRKFKAAVGSRGQAKWNIGFDGKQVLVQVLSIGDAKNKPVAMYTKNDYTYSEAIDPKQTLDNDPLIKNLRNTHEFPKFSEIIPEVLEKRTRIDWTIQYFPRQEGFATQQYDIPTVQAHTSLILPRGTGYEPFVEIQSEERYKAYRKIIDNLRILLDIKELEDTDFAKLQAEAEKNESKTTEEAKQKELQTTAATAEIVAQNKRKEACRKEFGNSLFGGKKRRRTHKKVKKNKKKTSRR